MSNFSFFCAPYLNALSVENLKRKKSKKKKDNLKKIRVGPLCQNFYLKQCRKQTDKPALHLVPSFYGVYILKSFRNPAVRTLDSTPDPKRRLRQHNGDLKVGGAYRTKKDGSRPWNMVVLVYGFPSRIAALQFEHSLQHAYQTRHIDNDARITSSSRQSSMHLKLANIRLLTTSFDKMSLKIAIFDEEVYRMWIENKHKIECSVPCTLFKFEEFCDSIKEIDIEDAKNVLLSKQLECMECRVSIDYFQDSTPNISSRQELSNYLSKGNYPLIGICGDHAFHLSCMARQHGPSMVPKFVTCTTCGQKLDWSDIIKVSTRLRHYVVQDSLHLAITQL